MASITTDRLNAAQAALAIKAPCDAVATSNITLSGEQTVGGVAVVSGDRVLVVGQTVASENGIYVVDTSAWSRAPDFDGNNDVVNGTLIVVTRTTGGRGIYYQVETANPITIGTTSISFVKIEDPNITYELTSDEAAEGLTVNDINDSYPERHYLRYKAAMDGSTDDSTAFENMVKLSGDLILPPGETVLNSANLTTLALKAGTKIIGAGKGLTKITLSGTTEVRLFSITNVSNIEISDLTIRGNNQASSYVSANAIYVTQTGSTEISNFTFKNLRLENFKSDAWICFHNNNGTAKIRDIHIENCTFQTESGNARGPTDIAIPAACIWFEGEESNTTGTVEDAWVIDCWFDCEHTKSGIGIWDNTKNINVRDPIILNAGKNGVFSDDKGSYAIFAYDNSVGAGAAVPTNVKIDGAIIVDPRDCGFYVTTAKDFQFTNFTITGQTSDADTTLPKGAIAINGGNGRIKGGTIDDCQIGIVPKPDSGETVYVENVQIGAIKTNGEGIKHKVGGGVDTGIIRISNGEVLGTATGVTALFIQTTNTGDVLEKLIIKDSEFAGPSGDIVLTKTAGNVDINETHIKNVRLSGGSAASNFGMTDNDNPVFIDDLTVISGGDFDAVDLRSCTIVHIDGLKLRNKTTGSNKMVNFQGTRGTLQGVVFQNVSTGQRFEVSGSNEMGSEIPTWTGDEGDYVQNINVAAPDGNNMMIDGWMYDGANWQTRYISTATPAT